MVGALKLLHQTSTPVSRPHFKVYLCSNLLNPTSPQPPPGQIGDDTGYSCTPSSSNHPLSGENFELLRQSDFIESLKA
jgi:hypothetical protein